MKEENNFSENLIVKDEKPSFRYFPFFNNRQPVFILAIIGVIFYCTSLYNEYALDDGTIIHQNESVLKGIKGLPKIFSSDVYDSFYKRMCAPNQTQGGRYRPLSVATFAIEQQFIRTYPTGLYMKTEDNNRNGKLDHGKVNYINSCGNWETNYEYNTAVDLNQNGTIEGEECNACWDLNNNFHNDADEDLNHDGVFNEVDCQVYGAYLRHFNNIWIYIVCCIALYILFRKYFFKNNPDLAFLAALIFLIHPVHSEVVANIRGRDDMLSVLFIALTFLFSFRYLSTKRVIHLAVALVLFLLALLSKEYGLVFLLLLPIAIRVFTEEKTEALKTVLFFVVFVIISTAMVASEYVQVTGAFFSPAVAISGILAFTFIVVLAFANKWLKNGQLLLMSGLFWITIIYLGIRINAVDMALGIEGNEILNNPFLFANGEEKFATKIYVLLKYFCIAVFPKTLVSDYSYGMVAYRHFTDWDFILSLVLHIALLFSAIWLTLKRHFLGFALSAYLIFLLVTGNFILGSGLLMAEANLYHATIGAVIIFSFLILKLFDVFAFIPFKTKRAVFISILLLASILCGIKTWERNFDWKNDVTLFLKDVKNAPNSVLVLGNAGARWIDLADTKEITGVVMPGEEHVKFNDYNGTLKISDEEVRNGNYKSKRETAIYKGIAYLEKAVKLHPKYVNGYLNLGLAYFKLGNDTEALKYWKYAEFLYPKNHYLQAYYLVYGNELRHKGALAYNSGDFKTAIKEYKKATLVDANDSDTWYYLGGCYFNLHEFAKARECWIKALKIDPTHENSKTTLKIVNTLLEKQ